MKDGKVSVWIVERREKTSNSSWDIVQYLIVSGIWTDTIKNKMEEVTGEGNSTG